MPTVGVEVYGSHATQLCLHWSDIDLVLIPKNLNQNQYQDTKGLRNFSPNNFSHSVPIYNGRHLWLEQVYEELRKEEHKSWISKV